MNNKVVAIPTDSWELLPEQENFSLTDAPCRVTISKQGTYNYPLPEFIISAEELPERTVTKINRNSVVYDPIYAVRVKDAILIDQCSVITNENKLLTDLSVMNRRRSPLPPNPEVPKEIEFSLPNKIPYLDQSLALIFFHSASGHHHSHWLIQTLPKVELFEKAQAKFDQLLVYDSIQPYQLEMLANIGYSKDKITIRKNLEPLRVKELYVMYTWNDIMPYFSAVERNVSQYSNDQAGPERVYVSRMDARHIRKFLNEQVIIEIVKKYDFQVVLPSTLSLADEIRIFRNARIICGPLGAGLYNTFFTKAGAFIMVIGDPCYAMDWMPELCGLKNHKLGYFFGNSFYSYDQLHRGTHNNWILDPDKFEKQLQNLLTTNKL